ncbi:tyrosine-type recombinase/integrase [Myxococcus sp. Y35]|uniref:tyrosine-type recombinase/integrase n=1 Tax=Pseudomyxococcus flavus TaxID=3115648 RepID=UPI003CF427A9
MHRTIHGYLRGAAHLLYCIERGHLELEGLTKGSLRAFADEHRTACRCRRKRPHMGSNYRSATIRLFDAMVVAGLPVGVPQREKTPFEEALGRYDNFRRIHKGVTASTQKNHERLLRTYLASYFHEKPMSASALSVEDVRTLMVHNARVLSPSRVRQLAVCLRSFFGFLAAEGDDAAAALVRAVPAARSVRVKPPFHRLVSPGDLALLFSATSGDAPTKLRNRAILTCLAELGLRRADVARLSIDDIDFRQGTVTLRKTKERRETVLPLPANMGDAIVRYLRFGRPKTRCRNIFVRHQRPVGQPLPVHTIGHVCYRVARAAGLKRGALGAHDFRRTMATRLVSAGAPLKEVADLLRHRELDVSAHYAHLDVEALRGLALPLPVGKEGVA